MSGESRFCGFSARVLAPLSLTREKPCNSQTRGRLNRGYEIVFSYSKIEKNTRAIYTSRHQVNAEDKLANFNDAMEIM